MIRGSVPNTRWPVATFSWEELRSMATTATTADDALFVPLPARSAAKPPPLPPPWRVRQDDSELTRVLHRGVLTGGWINGVLGFAEGGPAAARVGAPVGGGGGGGGGKSSKGSSRGRRRRGSLEQRPRLDPHSAAIEHLRQQRWDFTKPEAVPDFLLFEQEATKKKRKKKTPEEVARAGIVPVRLAWGNSAEAAALRALVNALRRERERERRGGEEGKRQSSCSSLFSSSPSSTTSSFPVVSAFDTRIEEVGMIFVSERALEELFGDSKNVVKPLPQLAASPDAVVRFRPSGSIGEGEEEDETFFLSSSSWVEPVEVKCVCPFRFSGRSRQRRRSGGRALDFATAGRNNDDDDNNETPSSSSKPYARYELSDPGPRHRPPASSMPQLQLQMLACRSPSALLVSHSATRGSRVWRVSRDDGFLREMLSSVVSPVFSRDVLGRGKDESAERTNKREHAAGVAAVMKLADAAVSMAAAAVEVAVLPAEEIDSSRAFLQ